LLILFSVAGFIETAFFGQISSFTPLVLPSMGVPPEHVAAWTGGVMSFANFFGILFLPFWGAFADRYSRKPVIVRSFIAHIVAIGFMLVSGNVWMFVIGRAVMNLSLGNTGLMMVTLAERAPANRIGIAFAILNGATTTGALLGPLAGGRIVDYWSFETLLIANGVLMLGLTAALTFGYHDAFKSRATDSVSTMAAESIRILFRSGQVKALFLAFIVLFSGWMLTRTYLPLVVTSLYKGDSPATVIGNIAALAGLVAVIVGPILGALSDRVGHWRVLVMGTIVSVVVWPLPALAWNLTSLAVAWAVLNTVIAAVFSVSFAVLNAATPEDVRGRVMSFAYLPLNVGMVFGPLLAAPIVESFGASAVFPLSAVLTLASVGLLSRARRFDSQ
jgi:MFS family permease